MLCYVLHSPQSRKQAWEHWIQGAIAQQSGTKDAFTESRERSEMGAAFEKTLDLRAGSPATGKSVAGINNLFVDDLFGTSGHEMEQRVLTRLRKDFQVGSEDWNDEAFTRQRRTRWTQDSQNGPYIEVSQNKAIGALEGFQWNEARRKTSSALLCTQCTEAFWDRNWPQSKTQLQRCYQLSRCASMAAAPTVGDVTSLNKLARQIKSHPLKLQYWPLTGPLRTLGFPLVARL